MPTSSRGAFFGTVLFLGIVAMTIFTGWKVGWWFRTENASLEGHVNRGSYAFQQAVRDRITTEIGEVLTINTQIAVSDADIQPPLKAQRKAITAQVCRDATEVSGDPLPADQNAFIGQNCLAGATSPSSPYNQ